MQYLKKLKFLFSEFFKILKCVTKRECVTSRVRKDPRGYCSSSLNFFMTSSSNTTFRYHNAHTSYKNFTSSQILHFFFPRTQCTSGPGTTGCTTSSQTRTPTRTTATGAFSSATSVGCCAENTPRSSFKEGRSTWAICTTTRWSCSSTSEYECRFSFVKLEK